MKKTNVCELANKEVENIVSGIEKGEIKTRKEYHEYLESIYNWKMIDAIESVISVYMMVNNIDMEWENETTETAE